MAGAAFLIGDAAQLEEVLDDGVAPDDGVAGLVDEAVVHSLVDVGVDASLERFPIGDELLGAGCSLVVAVIEVLDDGFAVVKLVCVRLVVEEKEQVVGGVRGRLVKGGNLGRILTDVARARCNGSGLCRLPGRRRCATGPSRCARWLRCWGRSGCR